MSSFVKSIFFVVVLFPTLGCCADAAMAIASGNVKLNGRPLARSSAVFAGDELRTDVNSAVVLHANGSTVQIGPAAVFEVHGDGISLMNGTMRVGGKMKVNSGSVIVNADLRKTSYMVTRTDGQTRVTAVRDSVRVRAGKNSVFVNVGETKVFSDTDSLSPTVAGSGKKARELLVGAASGAGLGAVVASHLADGEGKEISNRGFGR